MKQHILLFLLIISALCLAGFDPDTLIYTTDSIETVSRLELGVELLSPIIPIYASTGPGPRCWAMASIGCAASGVILLGVDCPAKFNTSCAGASRARTKPGPHL